VNEIRHFVPGSSMLVMTSGAEWRCYPGSTANALTTRIVNIQLLVIMAADFGILRTDVVDLWLAMFPHEIVRGRLGAIGGDKKPAGREPAGYRRGPGA